MRRRTNIKINPKHVLIVSVILCFCLMFLSFRYPERFSPVKEAIGVAITPMQRGVNIIGGYLSAQLDRLKSMNDLISENVKLKEQVNILSYENKLLLQDKYELDSLRALYELDQKYIDYPKVAARVIDKDPGNWYSVFKIDKGTRDGMAENMNVLAENGLAGIITEAYYNYSVVRAIIDDKSAISGMFLKTSDTCVVQGDLQLMDDGKIRVEFINKDAKIEDGYEVVTSHISDKFLQGILIGYVSDIKLDPGNMTQTAYLTPVVDFKRLEEVLIITELKEPLLDEDPNKDMEAANDGKEASTKGEEASTENEK